MFYEFLADLNFLVGFILFLCYSYQIFYTIVPFSIKPHRHKTPIKIHNIAILIAARNEQAVIGNLLDSISAQDYPAEHLQTIVIADNCTDSTASLSRERGATVFERFNQEKVGKGYAFDCFKKIRVSRKLLDTMLEAIEKQKKSSMWKRDKGQYIPNPSTWLNQKRWEDDLDGETDDDGQIPWSKFNLGIVL